jgi:hypothetical protein
MQAAGKSLITVLNISPFLNNQPNRLGSGIMLDIVSFFGGSSLIGKPPQDVSLTVPLLVGHQQVRCASKMLCTPRSFFRFGLTATAIQGRAAAQTFSLRQGSDRKPHHLALHWQDQLQMICTRPSDWTKLFRQYVLFASDTDKSRPKFKSLFNYSSHNHAHVEMAR